MATATDAILSVAVEGLAVGIFTLIASANDQMGSLVLIFMVGLWVIWLVTNSGTVSRLATTVGNINNLAGGH
jgi:hypothetical protein